jgi:hypothetical protein
MKRNKEVPQHDPSKSRTIDNFHKIDQQKNTQESPVKRAVEGHEKKPMTKLQRIQDNLIPKIPLQNGYIRMLNARYNRSNQETKIQKNRSF